jgi:hypothetical protein
MKMMNPDWNREWLDQKTARGTGGRFIVTKKRRGERRKVKMKMKHTKKTMEGIGAGRLDRIGAVVRAMINLT